MGEVIEFNQKRRFTREEARALLPVVRRITANAYDEVRKLAAQLAYLQDASDPGEKRDALEQQIQTAFQGWYQKVRKLGCEAKGMWLVDFDNGEGYYCWHYPESELAHFHGYADGFRGRVRIN